MNLLYYILDIPKVTKIHLIIAGECYNKKYLEELLVLLKQVKIKVSTHFRNIHDDEIQYFMNAADIVVFPFKRITTSSSILLALSFNKPVIYPYLGPFKELPKGLGIVYDYSDKNGLRSAILQAKEQKSYISKMTDIGFKYAESLNWDMIAKEVYKVYKD